MSITERPTTSSATERVFEYGALKTATPDEVAALRSTWLTPMQKQPTARSLSAEARTLSVTRVFERMPRRWTPRTAAANSSSPSAPESRVTPAYPPDTNSAAAASLMFSRRRILIFSRGYDVG
jgi:hypothetical protein